MVDPHCLLMTQHPVFLGTQMAFETIGFHAALIVNRLRCQAQLSKLNKQENERTDDEGSDELRRNRRDEEEARRKLALVKRRLADLAAFERRARGLKG